MFSRFSSRTLLLLVIAASLSTFAWGQTQEDPKKDDPTKTKSPVAKPGYPFPDDKDKDKKDPNKKPVKKDDKDKTDPKKKTNSEEDSEDTKKTGSKKPNDKNKKDLGKEKEKEGEKDSDKLPKKGSRPIGNNTPLPENYQPVIFEDGPFEGLESFGYGYFASAREAVQVRSMIRKDPELLKGQDTSSSSALTSITGPTQMSFTNAELPAPERYQVGPGDKILVRFSSPTQELKERTLVVDATGNITTPVMGTKITVRGMTLAQVQNAVERDIRRGLKEAVVTVTLSELRTISVSIVGEVIAQGNYQLPSVMTLFNALYAAGGPTINGSMRKIQLRRSNGKAVTVDLYAYLLRGDASQDIPLQPGDLIVVPLVTKRVAAKGEFSRSAVYEMNDTERVKDLLKFAGGAKPTAILDQAEIMSVNAGVEKQLVNINLKSESPEQNPFLKDADVVTLYPVRDAVENVVTVEGAVDQPRAYQYQSGMTVADALEKARGLLPDAYSLRGDLYRQNEDKTTQLLPIDLSAAIKRDATANIVLRRNDRIRVYFANEVNWLDYRVVAVQGAVRSPGKFVRMDGMRLSDVILQAGGLLPEASRAFIFIYRKNPDGSEGKLVKADVNLALGGSEEHNVVLQDRDTINVYESDRANFIPDRTVQIVGAVRTSGLYPRSDGLTLRDLLLLAGGLMPNAGGKIQIMHSRIKDGVKPQDYLVSDLLSGRTNPEMIDGDVVTIASNSDFVDAPQLVELRGRVKNPGVYTIQSRTETLADLIERAGGLNVGAWAEGSTFLRAPKFLTTDAEVRLSPRVQKVIDNIQDQEYLRALAKSDIDKIRVLSSQGGNAALSGLAGLGGGATTQPPLSAVDSKALQDQLRARETVTPARVLATDEVYESGNVPVRVDVAIRDRRSNHNVILKDGDIITIPDKPTTVAVRGAVVVPSAILYEGRKTLDYYLERSGGLTMDADPSQILVIRATGTITRARGSTRIQLGDTIFIPTRVMVARLTDGASSFEGAIKQLTNAGLVYAIFRNLIR